MLGYVRAGWVVVAVAAAIVGPHFGATGQEFGYALIALGSALLVVLAIRRHRPAHPRAWLLLAAAMTCSGTGSLVWAVQFSLGMPATPRFSAVDVLYFAMYPLLAAGLAMLPERPPGSSRWVGLAEAGIATCAGTTLAWILCWDPYIVDADRMPADTGAIAYPLLDLLLVAMAVRLLVVQRRLRGTHGLLLAMTVLLTVADMLYFLSVTGGGSWSGSGPSVTVWLAAFALPGLAALHPAVAARPAPAESGGESRTTVLHGLLVLVGPATTAFALLRDEREGALETWDFVVPLAATAVIALLLVVRMTAAQRQLRRHAASLAGALAEQAALQASLRHLAEHDALTGLPNRRVLEDRLAAGPYGLLLLDLDGFQDVNDRLGHQVGDQLLVAIAVRLGAVLGPGDLLTRTGGDEFAVLVPGDDRTALAGRADAVQRVLRPPVAVSGYTLYVTASIGVRPAGGTAAFGDADLALYAAKAAGKDCAIWYDPELRTRQTDRIHLVERLRRAVDDNEFAVHYQPIVDLDTDRTVAVEALLRWQPAEGTPVGPDVFIPVAEDSGLIIALGEWVLRRACADAAAWDVALTVNVSPRQLADDDFTAKVRRSLADSGMPPTALTLEITEGILVSSGVRHTQALAHLEALRADGIRIAVDDFGTGYSSLAYLRDLPIDTLKIDRSLMPADDRDLRQIALVRAVVDLARGLNLTSVAEGIETPVQAAVLRRLGCDRGQGFHWARAMPAADFTAVRNLAVRADAA